MENFGLFARAKVVHLFRLSVFIENNIDRLCKSMIKRYEFLKSTVKLAPIKFAVPHAAVTGTKALLMRSLKT